MSLMLENLNGMFFWKRHVTESCYIRQVKGQRLSVREVSFHSCLTISNAVMRAGYYSLRQVLLSPVVLSCFSLPPDPHPTLLSFPSSL